jgi:hypothetical protein
MQLTSKTAPTVFTDLPLSCSQTSSLGSLTYVYSPLTPKLLVLTSLVLIDIIFSTIAYWLSNFQPTAQAFYTWIMWLFLDLVAAESLVVFVSSIFPNFVVSLALTAFVNGLWMSVNGFMVSPKLLNVFWRYVFHYIDYQVHYLFLNQQG